MAPRSARALAVLAVLAVSAQGCGEDDTGEAGSGKSGGASLTLAIPTPGSDLQTYVADQNGFFKKRGLDVKIEENTGANTASLVVSGAVDIAQYGAGATLAVAGQGKKTSIIYAITGGGQGGSVFGAPGKTDTVDKFKGLGDDCRIGSFPPGSSTYGHASLYNENLSLGCQIVPLQDGPTQTAALASERIDVAFGGYGTFAGAVDQKKVAAVVDTRDPAQSKAFVGEPFPETLLWGLSSNLESKREAVKSYLAAMDEARQFIADASIDAIRDAIKGYPAMKSLTPPALDTTIKSFTPYMTVGSDNGYISEEQWALGLQRYALWGVPGFDPEAEQNTYEQAVDMSYYGDALGAPGGQ